MRTRVRRHLRGGSQVSKARPGAPIILSRRFSHRLIRAGLTFGRSALRALMKCQPHAPFFRNLSVDSRGLVHLPRELKILNATSIEHETGDVLVSITGKSECADLADENVPCCRAKVSGLCFKRLRVSLPSWTEMR